MCSNKSSYNSTSINQVSDDNIEESSNDTLDKCLNNAILEKTLVDLTSLETNQLDSNHGLDSQPMTHACYQDKSKEETKQNKHQDLVMQESDLKIINHLK